MTLEIGVNASTSDARKQMCNYGMNSFSYTLKMSDEDLSEFMESSPEVAQITDPKTILFLGKNLAGRKSEYCRVLAVDIIRGTPVGQRVHFYFELLGQENEGHLDIALLDALHDDCHYLIENGFPNPFYNFVDKEKPETVRELAARVFVLLNGWYDIGRLESIYDKEYNVLVKINLAAALFDSTSDRKYIEFLNDSKKCSDLEVAREVRAVLQFISTA